ncbi:uncharacterized protein LOC144660683 isoform X1 [Oculina patagonica]
MRIFLVLLAFLVNAVAQTPNTCPKPPTNLRCLIGLKNTCVDNSTCPTGTLCCNDGCRQRCRDPSNNNRGAGTGTRSGTCPSQLSPPPGPCASDSDECMLDADCDGSTKKCCFNNCFKECVEPGIGAIRDGCPAPRKSPRCHFGLRNQCSNNSECSYIKGGRCCFDGCRRRCAAPEGFPSRIEGARPGQCPITPPPVFCVSDADECEFDGDCFPGKKCCSNTCFTRCLDPVRRPGSNASEVGSLTAEGEASGKCPFTSTTNRCHIGLGHTCNIDKECPNATYCCFDGCRRKCLDPNDESAGAGQDKTGTCPTLVPPECVVSELDECFFDGDCVGDRKCCSNGCYRVCASPSLGAAAAAVKCPEPVLFRCSRSMKHQCDDSSDCFTGTNCCFDGCRRRCVSSTSEPEDTCPKPAENLICPVGLRNMCVDNESCRPGTVCCNDGCRKRCRDPSYFDSGGATESKPRPGTCPSLTPPSEFCPSDFDECKYDWDCEPTAKKCCSNGCYKVCAEPAVGEVRDKCPAPKEPKRCHVTLRNQCFNHSECSHISGGLCCYDGCRRRCASLDGFPSRIQNPRPGQCPRLLAPEICIAHYDECENDADCYPAKKCCSNGCFNRCVNPSFGETASITLDPASKCRNTTPLDKCHVELGHMCNDDVECENGTYCCFTGCRRQCWDPEDSSSAKLNKTGSCPVLPAPPACASVDECYMDNDCVKDKKCCSNGCYKICVSPKESGAAAVKCPAPKDYHCTTSLKPLCTNDCPRDGEICCFDGCRRKCIGYKSSSITEGVTITCRKSEMQIDVERGVLNGFTPIHLRLDNRSCIATANETHFSLVAPLMGCGTVTSHTNEAVVYSNHVEEDAVDMEGVITRMPELSIPFSCYYTKEGVTSTFGIIPRKVKMTMDGGKIKTEFTLEISVFKDEDYLLPYGIRDFPLKVSLSKPLYVQLAVDSPDTRLTIREGRCYATPTQNPDDKMQYDIIRESCIVDSTVTYYSSPQGTRRFSFDTFQFTGSYGSFVYLHCKLLVCNASDPTSRCSVSCFTDFPRRRRAMEEEKGVARAGLTEGPFIFRRDMDVERDYNTSKDSPFNITTVVVIAMAIFCAACLATIIYMKVKLTAKSQPDPNRETYL